MAEEDTVLSFVWFVETVIYLASSNSTLLQSNHVPAFCDTMLKTSWNRDDGPDSIYAKYYSVLKIWLYDEIVGLFVIFRCSKYSYFWSSRYAFWSLTCSYLIYAALQSISWRWHFQSNKMIAIWLLQNEHVSEKVNCFSISLYWRHSGNHVNGQNHAVIISYTVIANNTHINILWKHII